MRNIILIACLFVSVMFVSCKKDEVPSDVYDITITFREPDANAVFNNGDELHIEVDFEREGMIHNVEVTVLNETTGDTIFYSGEILAETNDYYAFHEHVDLSVAMESDCKIIASSWADDKQEKLSEEVSFTILP